MRTPVFEPQGSAGTRNPTFGAPGRGVPEFVFHRPVLLRPSRPCLMLIGPAPSAGPHSLPASPRRPLSAGIHAVPRHLPSTPPPARRGTSGKHRPSIRPCGKMAAPQLPRSPQLVLCPARSAHPWSPATSPPSIALRQHPRSSRPSWAARRRRPQVTRSSRSSAGSAPLPRGRGLPWTRPVGGARDRPNLQLGGPPLQLGLLKRAPHVVHPHHLPGGRHQNFHQWWCGPQRALSRGPHHH